jgi:hypothetical protein
MKVRDLCEKLHSMNPDAEVVYSGSDHSYIKVRRCNQTKAEDCDGDLYEYYDDRNKSHQDSPIVAVVVLE